GAATARHSRVAALDDEAGNDAVEDRVVEEPVARERDERGRRVGRGLLVEPDRERAARGLKRHVVLLRVVERLARLLLPAAVARRGLLDVAAHALRLLRLLRCRVRLGRAR